MDTVLDFEDMLDLLDRHGVRYLIVGGLAFIYHAKPRYTKDMDLWLDPEPANVERTNQALAEFGSPHLLDPADREEVVQLGVEPNRIDLLRNPGDLAFEDAWELRIKSTYGRSRAFWIDLDSLIKIKGGINHPRHQDDARVLRQVRDRGSREE